MCILPCLSVAILPCTVDCMLHSSHSWHGRSFRFLFDCRRLHKPREGASIRSLLLCTRWGRRPAQMMFHFVRNSGSRSPYFVCDCECKAMDFYLRSDGGWTTAATHMRLSHKHKTVEHLFFCFCKNRWCNSHNFVNEFRFHYLFARSALCRIIFWGMQRNGTRWSCRWHML